MPRARVAADHALPAEASANERGALLNAAGVVMRVGRVGRGGVDVAVGEVEVLSAATATFGKGGRGVGRVGRVVGRRRLVSLLGNVDEGGAAAVAAGGGRGHSGAGHPRMSGRAAGPASGGLTTSCRGLSRWSIMVG